MRLQDLFSVTPASFSTRQLRRSFERRMAAQRGRKATAFVHEPLERRSMCAVAVPAISVQDMTVTEQDSGKQLAVFTLTLSAATRSTVSARFATANGTATAGSDYLAKSGVVTFAPGTTVKRVMVDIKGDRAFEPNETFSFTLASPKRATIARATALGTIVNNDPAPAVAPRLVAASAAPVAQTSSAMATSAVTAPLSTVAASTTVQAASLAGRVFMANPAAEDIVGFDPTKDRLDFGEVSVHNLILGKTASGEVAIVNPWASTPEYQVLRGIRYSDLSIANFGTVQNEHLRQDIGGVLSWERATGPRSADTVYVRSHEYGVQERVVGFNPAVGKLSFLYFGTRERLRVADTAEGLLISVEPTGQSLLLVGVLKSQLVPANIQFHHDQIVEDQLEVPFGFTVPQLTLVSRGLLLTPLGPAGQITDGLQTSVGTGTQPVSGGTVTPPASGGEECCPQCGAMGCTGTHTDHDHGTTGEKMPASGVFAITWTWNENRTFSDFDPATDVLALDWFRGADLQLTEDHGSAVLRIPSMQQSYTLSGVPLSRLGVANFTFKDASAGVCVCVPASGQSWGTCPS